MSSSDAITHGASVSFGRDICKAVYPKITESTELWIMRGAVFGVGFISYFIAIFGSDGLIQLLLGAYGPIAQLAPGVYAALFYKKANKNSIILGLTGGVIVTLYYQYFSESSIYDLHPGLLGISVNIIIVVIGSMLFKQSKYEKEKAKEFITI